MAHKHSIGQDFHRNLGPPDKAQKNGLNGMSANIGHRDALYLFVCHLEWRDKRNVAAYQELIAALDDPDCEIRHIAEVLLRRSSPRFEATDTSVKAWWDNQTKRSLSGE